jgi:hypothetical protein
MLQKRFNPWLTKKFVEVLGDESPELVSYIIKLLENHSEPLAICDELKKVLDEEAVVFVMKFWRVVVFESEARAKELQ